jgi:hypothetical protein
LSLVESKLLSL